jgi:glucosamine-6-phosphate deaminase
MSREVCKLLTKLIKNVNVLGLATGSSQTRLYHYLIKAYRSGSIDFSSIKTFNLDEYYKINPNFSLSYRYYMDTHFFNHINLPKENINFLNSLTNDPKNECLRYEKKIISLGGIDCQLLGIGVNGHIAFCEPKSDFDCVTRMVKLSKDTIKQNSDGRFYKNKNEVPKYALTMGIKTIMSAKKILVLANGPRKAMAVKKAIEGPVTNEIPASILQRHDDVTWYLDKEASSQLSII